MNDTQSNLPVEAVEREKARGPRRTTSFIALVLALVTSVMVAWLVYDGNRRAERTTSAIAELRDRVEAQERHSAEVLAASAQQRDAIVVGMRDLEKRIEETERTLGRRGWDWMLAEAEYFLSLGSEQLVLNRSVSVAISAFEVADLRLRRADVPEVLAIREEIAKSIVTLRKLDHPDIAGYALNLSALIGAVSTFPTSRPQQRGASAPASTAPVSASRNPWAQIWAAFSSMFVVRHGNQLLPSLLTPEQLTMLRLNVQLRLENARAALMRNDQTNFVAALREAREGFQTYFDMDAPEVAAAVRKLTELESANIAFLTPDISAPLQMLRNVRSQLELRTTRPGPPVGGSADSGVSAERRTNMPGASKPMLPPVAKPPPVPKPAPAPASEPLLVPAPASSTPTSPAVAPPPEVR